MKIARIILAILLLTSFAHARGFMTGVGPSGISGPFLSVSCVAGGLVSVPSTNFTITYPAATFNGTTNTITLSAVPAGGTFTPVSPITPTAISTSTTFTYTPPATPQVYTITIANNIIVPVVPSSCNYNATSSVAQNPLPLVIP